MGGLRSFRLDRNENVDSWAKNDHLGFVITYVYRGVVHKYYRDFIMKLSNGKTPILEVKGKDDQQNKTKREYLREWVNAVNSDGRFGKWGFAVSFRTSDIKDIINKHSKELSTNPLAVFPGMLGTSGKCCQNDPISGKDSQRHIWKKAESM